MLHRLFVMLVALFVAASAAAQESITTSKIYLGSAEMASGSGSPEGVVTAPVGSTWYRTDTGRVYVKLSGSSSTGWSEIYQVGGAPVRVADGGTNLQSYAVGDLIYANGMTSLARLAAPSAGQVLASAGVGTPPSWTASPSLTAIGGAANLTLNPTGDLIIGAAGHDVLPSSGYTKNLGALTNKFLTLHAAELWVETLVAQNTMATIGGRVLVGPTTSLTSDLSNVATSIVVKHNQMANGDRVVLQANGQIEWLAVTSGPSGGGPYTYTVTRNLDGSGANAWTAGDAVFNTGQTSDGCPSPGLLAGDGYIDLYSVNGLLPGSTAGPTIVGNVRTGCSYSQVAARWAIGNLNGLYGYGSDTYGAAFGDNDNAWVKIDPANGVRIGEAGNTFFQVNPAGEATFSGTVTVGQNRNLLSYTEFLRATKPLSTATWSAGSIGPDGGEGDGQGWGWQQDSNTGLAWTHSCNLTGWFPVMGGACYASATALWSAIPAAGTYMRIWGPRVPVIGGKTYEYSAYLGLHRACGTGGAGCRPRVIWYDAANAYLGESDGTSSDFGYFGEGWGGQTLTGYTRMWAFHTAPANAAYAQLSILAYFDGAEGGAPYVFYTRPFFAEAYSGQTRPSNWSPGGTTQITGDMLSTNLVISNKLMSRPGMTWTTGTGFFLDGSTSTPLFRVGNPSGNQIRWDGSQLSVGPGNVLLNDGGIEIKMNTSQWLLTANALRFPSVGDTGVSALGGGYDANGKYLYLQVENDSDGDYGRLKLIAKGETDGGAERDVSIEMSAGYFNGSDLLGDYIKIDADSTEIVNQLFWTGDLAIGNIRPGGIAKTSFSGLSIIPVAGSSYDFAIGNRDKNAYVVTIPTGNNDALQIHHELQLIAFGAGTLVTDALGNVAVASDARLKEQVHGFDAGLSAIAALRPVRYHWNEASGLDRSQEYVGFLAQDVQQVLPEAVGVDARGYLTLQDRTVLAALVNAVRELAARVSALEAKVP